MDHDWLGPTLERLAGLIMMPGRNNSYACAKVTPAKALPALMVLMTHMRPWTPPPRIMPTESGGIVLEWHEKGLDIALSFNGEASPEDPVLALKRPLEISEEFRKLHEICVEPKP